jgi:hypothetical protein
MAAAARPMATLQAKAHFPRQETCAYFRRKIG